MKLNQIIRDASILVMLTSCGHKAENTNNQRAPQEYPVIQLQEQDAVLESVYPVIIRGKEDIEIRPRVDGFIDAIYIDEGSIVKKGQKLFKINSPQSDQSVATAKASVTSAIAQVNTAKLNVDRIRPLAEKGIVSDVQLQSLENAYQSAVAVREQAQADLTNATETQSWTLVTSPVDGIAGRLPFRQGSLVSSSNILTTIANINKVYAYFSLNEKELMQLLTNIEGRSQADVIKHLPPITLILADGSIYPEKGKIETIAGVLDVSTGSSNFRAEFPNPHGLLRSGMSGKISIPKTLHQALVIPQKATFTRQDKTLVYKVQGDSVVQKAITALPMPGGQEYAVTEGLTKGDKIVTDGLTTLANGKKIKVQ